MGIVESGVRNFRGELGTFLDDGAGGAGGGGAAGGDAGDAGKDGAGGKGSGGDAGAGGAGDGAWFDSLPDDLKGDAALGTYKGKPVAEALTALRDLSKKVAESAPPATPKEYQVKIPARPDGTPADAASLEVFLPVAHAAGFSSKQLQALLDFEAGSAKTAFEADTKASAAAEKNLKGKWGDKYDENVALVGRAIEAMPEDLKKIVTAAGIGSHPHFVELIHTIGEARREGRLQAGDPGGAVKPIAERLYGVNPT